MKVVILSDGNIKGIDECICKIVDAENDSHDAYIVKGYDLIAVGADDKIIKPEWNYSFNYGYVLPVKGKAAVRLTTDGGYGDCERAIGKIIEAEIMDSFYIIRGKTLTNAGAVDFEPDFGYVFFGGEVELINEYT